MEIVNITSNHGRVASNAIYATIQMIRKQRKFNATLPESGDVTQNNSFVTNRVSWRVLSKLKSRTHTINVHIHTIFYFFKEKRTWNE